MRGNLELGNKRTVLVSRHKQFRLSQASNIAQEHEQFFCLSAIRKHAPSVLFLNCLTKKYLPGTLQKSRRAETVGVGGLVQMLDIDRSEPERCSAAELTRAQALSERARIPVFMALAPERIPIGVIGVIGRSDLDANWLDARRALSEPSRHPVESVPTAAWIDAALGLLPRMRREREASTRLRETRLRLWRTTNSFGSIDLS